MKVPQLSHISVSLDILSRDPTILLQDSAYLGVEDTVLRFVDETALELSSGSI
jgi:hypothetical protein